MKKLACMLFAGVFTLQSVMTVQATTISDAQEKKQEAQENLDSVNNSIEALENNKAETKSYIQNLDSQLVDLIASIEILNGEIEAKQVELDECRVELKAAKETEAQQYEDMKKRIQFMYENGDSTLLTALLESESITDLLNKVEYVGKIYEYDRNLLEEYQAAKEAVEALEVQLKEDQADLKAMQNENKQQKDSLQVLIDEKKEEIENFDAQLAEAESKAAEYRAEIQAQNEAIRAEEERQAAAAAAAAEAAARNTPSSGGNPSSPSGGSSNTPTPAPTASGSGVGSAVVNYALQFVGNPYVWGGTSLTNGADCSGFTQSVFANFGVALPRTSTQQRSVGYEVSYADAQPGDLICYSGHVAIYMGNGQIVHAASAATGIRTGTATYRPILSVRRVI